MKRKSDSASGRSPGKKRCRKEAGGAAQPPPQPPSNAELDPPGQELQEPEEQERALELETAQRQETPHGLQSWVDTYLVRLAG